MDVGGEFERVRILCFRIFSMRMHGEMFQKMRVTQTRMRTYMSIYERWRNGTMLTHEH